MLDGGTVSVKGFRVMYYLHQKKSQRDYMLANTKHKDDNVITLFFGNLGLCRFGQLS